MKTITYTPAAAKQVRKLPADIAQRIVGKLKAYASSGAGDVVAFKGLPGGARLRVGDWRVVFIDTGAEIDVQMVGHRREIYD